MFSKIFNYLLIEKIAKQIINIIIQFYKNKLLLVKMRNLYKKPNLKIL